MNDQYQVVAVEIKTGTRRLMCDGMNEKHAESYTKMAVMRRGCDKEMFVVEPHGTPLTLTKAQP